MMQRIHKDRIHLGKPLPWDLLDRHGQLLLRRHQVVHDQTQLDALLTQGLFVFDPDMDPQENSLSPFVQIAGAQLQLRHIFDQISQEQHLPDKIMPLCQHIQSACAQDPDAALCSVFIEKTDPYTITHPVHTAILCELVCKRHGLSTDERLPVLAATLTMNLAIVDLQELLRIQQAPLDQTQREQIAEHPQRTVHMLQALGVDDNDWLDAVLQHHEAIDGSGYHQGLSGDHICIGARMIALGDIYCAMVSSRAYRPSTLPNMAMQEIFLLRGQRIDPQLAQTCIQTLGIYPPGTFVRLVNSETAIVFQRGSNAHNPSVYSVLGPWGAAYPEPILRDCSNAEFALRSAVSPKEVSVRVDHHTLWGYS